MRCAQHDEPNGLVCVLWSGHSCEHNMAPYGYPGPARCQSVEPRSLTRCVKAQGHARWHEAPNTSWRDAVRLVSESAPDMVAQPPHYTSHPSGIECIEIVRHMGYCLGNVIKYVWRADLKADALEDLRKARQYLDFEIETREKAKA